MVFVNLAFSVDCKIVADKDGHFMSHSFFLSTISSGSAQFTYSKETSLAERSCVRHRRR